MPTFIVNLFLVLSVVEGENNFNLPLRSFKTAKIIESSRGRVFREENQFSSYPLQITRQAAAHLSKFDNKKFGKPLLERNGDYIRAKRSSSDFIEEPVGVEEEYRDEASGVVVRSKRSSNLIKKNDVDDNITMSKYRYLLFC